MVVPPESEPGDNKIFKLVSTTVMAIFFNRVQRLKSFYALQRLLREKIYLCVGAFKPLAMRWHHFKNYQGLKTSQIDTGLMLCLNFDGRGRLILFLSPPWKRARDKRSFRHIFFAGCARFHSGTTFGNSFLLPGIIEGQPCIVRQQIRQGRERFATIAAQVISLIETWRWTLEGKWVWGQTMLHRLLPLVWFDPPALRGKNWWYQVTVYRRPTAEKQPSGSTATAGTVIADFNGAMPKRWKFTLWWVLRGQPRIVTCEGRKERKVEGVIWNWWTMGRLK